MTCNVEIRKMSYQRNGINGIGFYQALIDFRDGDERATGLIATFEMDSTEEDGHERDVVKDDSCRVVDVFDLENHWRGDVFGEAIQRKLTQLKAELKKKTRKRVTTYDVKEYISKSA